MAVIQVLNSKMASSIRSYSLSVAVVIILIIPLFLCQESENNNFNENGKKAKFGGQNGTISDSTPASESIIDPEVNFTEEIYKLLPAIEEELHKLSKDEFKIYMKKLLTRLQIEYESLSEILKNFEKEEKEEEEKEFDKSTNSTLMKRIKRSYNRGCGGCSSGCGSCGGYRPTTGCNTGTCGSRGGSFSQASSSSQSSAGYFGKK